MSGSPAHAPAAPGISVKWIALSAAIGGLGMWLVLSHGRDASAPPAAAAPGLVAANGVAPPSVMSPDAAPWPATAAPAAVPAPAVRSSAPQAPPARPVETALPSPELGPPLGDPADYALDDATLTRRARTQFGLDCPGIAERRARRSGRFEVICTNGMRLRVNLMGDGPPGITEVQ